MQSEQKSDAPQVSVVVPCYNGGRFLEQLLATLSAQTFRDFEIIIVDDGSDDGETPARLAGLPPLLAPARSIRVVRQANLGPGAARNAGFRVARAPFVFPLDCDDTIAPNLIADAMSRLASATPDVAVACSYLRLGGPDGEVLARGLDRFEVLFSNTLSSCFLIRKEAWERIGGYDEAMRDGYEDWEFALNLAHAGYRGIAIPEPLYVYRYTEGGLLFGRSSDRHGALWRHIRAKHRDLYRLPAVVKLWWQAPKGTRRLSLLKALAMLAFAELTSDAYQTGVIARRRRARFFQRRQNAAL
jgi:glycosyltransferase involved in cell wall biosynthesis